MSLSKRYADAVGFFNTDSGDTDRPYTGVHATPEEHERWKASLRRQEAEDKVRRAQDRATREGDAREDAARGRDRA